MKTSLTNIVVTITILLLISLVNSASAEITNLRTDSIALNKTGQEEKIYQVIEQMPVYPGGELELLNFINKNINYPVHSQQNNVQGRVIVRFVVSNTGQVNRVEVIRSLDPECDKEAVRVIKLLPKFIPGKQNGANVAVWFMLPITFKLDGSLKSTVNEEQKRSGIYESFKMTDNKPIYFIDEKDATEAEVKALNPQSIKEVKVLKDATATAIYGIRGANGVVLITLKK